VANYRDLTNSVLRRLREKEMTTSDLFADDDYWSLISAFINDAKREVEDSWNWTDFRTTLTLTTTASTTTLDVTGSTSRTKILGVYDTTNNVQLRPIPHAVYNRFTKLGTQQEASPLWYRRRGVNASGEMVLELYPIPDSSAYSIDVYCTTPQDDLSAETDTLNLIGVDSAIIYKAYSMAISERGEDGGNMFTEIVAQYDRYLANAIQQDLQDTRSELDWYVE
jgi:hypothetical protein